MARPRKDQTLDLGQSHDFTAGLIDALTCPTGKAQAFMRDSEGNGLRVRVTTTGSKSYVYEAKLDRQTIRRTIGDVRLFTIKEAREKAIDIAKLVKSDKADPRELERAQYAARAAISEAATVKVQTDKLAAVTMGEVWVVYLAERRNKPKFGERHYQDHVNKAAPGGIPSTRRGYTHQLTQPGPLAPLMGLPLRELTAPVVEAWASREAATRPTSARLAWRLLKVFLNWCSENSQYASLLPAKNPAKTKKSRESLGKAKVKADVLQREQLAVWFGAVRQIQNPVIAAALQVMLLTGARPGEVLGLRWGDVNTRWKGITIRDKVEGTREIPATAYVLHLLSALPRRNDWVFSSVASAAGRLTSPNVAHTSACTVAGIDGLTLHGLRRSFKSLTEWLDVPAGIVAQLMGHKPSATAEKHYTVRPLELLALHHNKIEAWILEQAGIKFEATHAPGALRVVQAA